MVAALGVNIKWLNTLVFALGAALAGLAGVMAGPIVSVQPGMGEPVLILTLVVIIIGGLGSIRGAFFADRWSRGHFGSRVYAYDHAYIARAQHRRRGWASVSFDADLFVHGGGACGEAARTLSS